MTVDPTKRREQVMIYEGQAINVAGRYGLEAGLYNARCCADGAMNALIRLGGVEDAAQYAFALADRVAGGIRAPTEFPPKLAAAPAPVEVKPADPPKPARMRFFTIFIAGWLCGFYTAWSLR